MDVVLTVGILLAAWLVVALLVAACAIAAGRADRRDERAAAVQRGRLLRRRLAVRRAGAGIQTALR